MQNVDLTVYQQVHSVMTLINMLYPGITYQQAASIAVAARVAAADLKKNGAQDDGVYVCTHSLSQSYIRKLSCPRYPGKNVSHVSSGIALLNAASFLNGDLGQPADKNMPSHGQLAKIAVNCFVANAYLENKFVPVEEASDALAKAVDLYDEKKYDFVEDTGVVRSPKCTFKIKNVAWRVERRTKKADLERSAAIFSCRNKSVAVCFDKKSKLFTLINTTSNKKTGSTIIICSHKKTITAHLNEIVGAQGTPAFSLTYLKTEVNKDQDNQSGVKDDNFIRKNNGSDRGFFMETRIIKETSKGDFLIRSIKIPLPVPEWQDAKANDSKANDAKTDDSKADDADDADDNQQN